MLIMATDEMVWLYQASFGNWCKFTDVRAQLPYIMCTLKVNLSRWHAIIIYNHTRKGAPDTCSCRETHV